MPRRGFTWVLGTRSATAESWAADNPVLHYGQAYYDTTNRLVKIGDGVRRYNDTEYAFTGPPGSTTKALHANLTLPAGGDPFTIESFSQPVSPGVVQVYAIDLIISCTENPFGLQLTPQLTIPDDAELQPLTGISTNSDNVLASSVGTDDVLAPIQPTPGHRVRWFLRFAVVPGDETGNLQIALAPSIEAGADTYTILAGSSIIAHLSDQPS